MKKALSIVMMTVLIFTSYGVLIPILSEASEIDLPPDTKHSAEWYPDSCYKRMWVEGGDMDYQPYDGQIIQPDLWWYGHNNSAKFNLTNGMTCFNYSHDNHGLGIVWTNVKITGKVYTHEYDVWAFLYELRDDSRWYKVGHTNVKANAGFQPILFTSTYNGALDPNLQYTVVFDNTVQPYDEMRASFTTSPVPGGITERNACIDWDYVYSLRPWSRCIDWSQYGCSDWEYYLKLCPREGHYYDGNI